MKIAVIGGGFTGLAIAVDLVDAGEEVVVFEGSEQVGGLAAGFRPSGWRWSLEKYYHHIFSNDKAIKDMAERVGWPAYLVNPKTKTWKEGVVADLDSPIALLRYSQLSIWSRLRMGMGLAILKLVMWPSLGMKFEKYRVVEMLPKLVGREGYEKIWRPMLEAKFGKEVGKVNMAWFWARVFKRTKRLGYFKGGFQKLAEEMAKYLKKKGGVVKLNEKVREVESSGEGYVINGEKFDQVVLTVPAPLVEKIAGEVISMPKIDYLWGQALIIELEESLMESYWLNVLEPEWPFLVVVEHTRLVDKRNYGGKHVVYVGNYLSDGDKRLKMSASELLNLFWPYLKKINPKIKKGSVKRKWKFQSLFAQPVFPVNYSDKLPEIKTSKKGLWVANMSMVYPWDRGTNYAVELGQRVAKRVLEE